MADELRRPEAPETQPELPPAEGADHHQPAGSDHWIRLPKLSVPRIEVSDVQLPDIRVPRVIGPAVRPVPDETRRRFDALMTAAGAGALQLSGRLAKAGGRALLIRPRSPVTRVGFAVPVVGLVVIAAGTGAALAYVFDPVSGLERRARVRRQLAMGSQRIGLALGQARRQAISAIAARRPQVRESRAIAEPELMPASQPASRSVVAANTRAMSMVGASSTDATSGNGIG